MADILAFSQTVEDHNADIGQVLTLLGSTELKLRMETPAFLAEKIDYWGHVIRPRRLEISDATTKPIQ